MTDAQLIATSTLLATILSVLLSICFSCYTRRQDNYKLHKRKVIERIEEVSESGCIYWSYDGNDIQLEQKIKHHIEFLMQDVQNILRCKNKEDLTDKLVFFKKTVTGGYFESSQKIADENRVSEILEMTSKLRGYIVEQ